MSAPLSTLSDADLRAVLVTTYDSGQEDAFQAGALDELLRRAASAQARFDEALRDELTYGLTPARDPDEGYSRFGEARVKDPDNDPLQRDTLFKRLNEATEMADGMCQCDCASVCPLGRAGSALRCTKGELEGEARRKGWLT